MPAEQQLVDSDEIPAAIIKEMREMGLFGLTIPAVAARRKRCAADERGGRQVVAQPDPEAQHRSGELLDRDPDLHAGQVGADAVVRAVAAEGDVRVGAAQDVEAVRLVKDLVVEVGRAVEQHQPLALFDRHAAELGVG